MKRIGWFVVVLSMLAALLPLGVQAVEMEIPAKSALLMDASTGTVLYESNSHEALAPASVTKVMTLLLIMEAVDGGRIGWEDMVTVSETAAAKASAASFVDMTASLGRNSRHCCAMRSTLVPADRAATEMPKCLTISRL